MNRTIISVLSKLDLDCGREVMSENVPISACQTPVSLTFARRCCQELLPVNHSDVDKNQKKIILVYKRSVPRANLSVMLKQT